MSAFNTAWMLLTAGDSGAESIPLRASIGAGARGSAVRRVALARASGEALESAAAGVRLAYELLYREKYVDREIEVRFEAHGRLDNLHGRSADLAFALALTAAMCGADGEACFDLPPLAATGVLNDNGGVEAVEGLPRKLVAALATLPRGATVLFPRRNETELTLELRGAAAAQGIILAPVARLEEALQHVGVRLSQTWLDSPFRGLEPFEFRHASIFFGREREIEDILALIQRRTATGQSAILIEGPSGGGKSSLVLAGVLPALVRRGAPDLPGDGFRWGLLRPHAVEANADPKCERESLAAAFRMAWLHGEQGGLTASNDMALAAADVLAPASVLSRLERAAPGQTRFVLILDQMEQWFDGRLQPATVTELANLVAGLAERGVWVIATGAKSANSDVAGYAALAAAFGVEGRYDLTQQLGPASLEAVIREPAKAARLRFEPGLDAQLFAAASHGGADVLPLLELLLTELYERCDRTNNTLRMSDYHDVGGLDGIISARAEAAYDRASPSEQAMFAPLIWNLKTVGRLRLSEYPAESPMLGLASAFLARRLLVQDAGPDGQASVRAAHGALLRHWRRAVDLHEVEEADIQLWRDVIREAAQWRRNERSLIAAGPQLDAAYKVYKRRLTDWTSGDAPAVDYLRASVRSRSRRRFLTGLAIAVPTTAAGALAAATLPRIVTAMNTLHVRFDDADVGPPRFEIAAAPFLRAHGLSVVAMSPAASRLLIQGKRGLYDGRAAAKGAKDQHFLTQMADPPTAPISFTLASDRPARIIRLIRAGLWAATGSGVTHPAWTATAYDAAGTPIDTVGEELRRAFQIQDAVGAQAPADDIAAKTFVLEAGGDRPIHTVAITSDYRLNGRPFAGFQAVLLHEIQLVF